MKTHLPLLTLATFLFVGCGVTQDVQKSSYRTIPGKWTDGFAIDDERFTKLCNDSARADLQLEYTGDDQFISHQSGVRLPRHSKIQDLTGYLQRFPNKGFVVVVFHKLAQIESVDDKVKTLNHLFFTAGYRRVLITGYRAFSRQVYSDRILAERERRKTLIEPLDSLREDGASEGL